MIANCTCVSSGVHQGSMEPAFEFLYKLMTLLALYFRIIFSTVADASGYPLIIGLSLCGAGFLVFFLILPHRLLQKEKIQQGRLIQAL